MGLNQIGAGNSYPLPNLQNLLLKVTVSLSTGMASLIGILLCLIALFTSEKQQVAAAANQEVGEGTWITYTTTHGLPSNTVWGGVTVDDAGRVWAGFENGDWNDPLPLNELMSRLDGNSWLNYELPGCRVRPLAAADHVYVGTYCPGPPSGSGGGLTAFIENTWVTFTPADGMMGTYVSAIAPEGNTKVWLAAGDNIFCYGYVSLLDHKGTADKADDDWTHFTFGLCGIYAIAVDPQGNRWFGTSDGVRVLLADNTTWVIYSSDLIEFATDITFDEIGNTWFARNDEVTRFDGNSWLHYKSREEAIENNFAAIMTSVDRNQINPHVLPGLWIVEEPAGVWIIRPLSDGGGVGFYDGQTWTIYTQENSALGSNDIRGIAIDQQRNVWTGTRAGLPPAEGGISKFTPPPDFSLESLPITLFIEPSEQATLDITVSLKRGWVPSTTLFVAGLPNDTAATWSTNPVTPTAQAILTITTTPATSLGTYILTINAAGQGVTQTATVTLHVVSKTHRSYLPMLFSNSGGINEQEIAFRDDIFLKYRNSGYEHTHWIGLRP